MSRHFLGAHRPPAGRQPRKDRRALLPCRVSRPHIRSTITTGHGPQAGCRFNPALEPTLDNAKTPCLHAGVRRDAGRQRDQRPGQGPRVLQGSRRRTGITDGQSKERYVKASGRRGYAISSLGTGHCGKAAFFAALTALVTLAFGAGSASAATPELKIDPTVVAGYTSVEFSGEVDPNGDPVEWYVERSTDGGANWEVGETLGFSEEDTPQPITNAVLGGLAQGTTYKIRISAYDYTTEELLVTPEPSPEFTTKSVAAPSAVLDPITTKTDTTAVLTATVDPNSPGGLSEEGKNLFATAYEFHCSPECPGLTGGTVPAEASGSELEVEAQATKLEPNTEYTVTLSATNGGGEATDGPQTFVTDTTPLTVSAGTATPLGGGVTQIAGTVNPHNSAITSCYSEYGPTAPS